MSQKEFGDQVLEVLEAHPDGLSFQMLQEVGGLTKAQAKAGLAYLRRSKGRMLLWEDGIIKLPTGPEDAMRVVVNRIEALAEQVVIQLYGVDRLVEEQGVSEELEELCRAAIGATKRIDHALRFLDILDGREGWVSELPRFPENPFR